MRKAWKLAIALALLLMTLSVAFPMQKAAAEPERTRGLSWLPVTLGGVALIVIVVGGWIVVRRRKS